MGRSNIRAKQRKKTQQSTTGQHYSRELIQKHLSKKSLFQKQAIPRICNKTRQLFRSIKHLELFYSKYSFVQARRQQNTVLLCIQRKNRIHTISLNCCTKPYLSQFDFRLVVFHIVPCKLCFWSCFLFCSCKLLDE